MIKDIKELGIDIRSYFLEIDQWEELKFDEEDKSRLVKIEGVVSVMDHSIMIKLEDNHCIIPSQYLLYGILTKELAIRLRTHVDLFDKIKRLKSKDELGDEVESGKIDTKPLRLDSFSSQEALKPIYNEDSRFGAKSIINGRRGDYKIRQSRDFFSSVILKIINVPDSSSSMLGRIIYDLAGDSELYDYLEKKYLYKLPFVLKDKTISKFASKVFSFLLQYDSLAALKVYMLPNKKDDNWSIKVGDLTLTSIFKISDKVLSLDELKLGSKPRYFEHPLFTDENGNYVYFSTEWTYSTDSRLDLITLAEVLSSVYPEFRISKNGDEYVLKSSKTLRTYANYQVSNFKSLISDLKSSKLEFKDNLIFRFIASLLTKPFVILTGLSGSGKTKLAQAFAKWICEKDDQYKVIPVGADWTNREPLLGFPNALNKSEYVTPDNGALKLVIEASNNPDKPYFLILDEMNLSHVERYFADFLSAMESKEPIPLHDSKDIQKVPPKVALPENLFIIGTVNIDETTNMFSPKVLDRANTIEFRVNKDDIAEFFKSSNSVNLNELSGKGASVASSFLKMASDRSVDEVDDGIKKELLNFFDELKKAGAEYGYRTANEMLILAKNLKQLGIKDEADIIDCAVMQKLLPKLHGSRRKLSKRLEILAQICTEDQNLSKGILDNSDFILPESGVKYPVSLEKIHRMYQNALENGYTSFAEA